MAAINIEIVKAAVCISLVVSILCDNSGLADYCLQKTHTTKGYNKMLTDGVAEAEHILNKTWQNICGELQLWWNS